MNYTHDISVSETLFVPAWKIVDIRHVPASENSMRHLIYVTLENSDGTRFVNNGRVVVRYGWEGQREDENPWPAIPDKPYPEPHCNIANYPAMKTWVEVLEEGTRSDRVYNIHTMWPSDGEGNDVGHHSFSLTFRRVDAPLFRETSENNAAVARDSMRAPRDIESEIDTLQEVVFDIKRRLSIIEEMINIA